MLRVKAFIDGRSRLFISGKTVTWHHYEDAAPGRWNGNKEPTELNGKKWFPDWPDVPDLLNSFCNCSSSSTTVTPSLASKDQLVGITIIKARGKVFVPVQPNSGNSYTAQVEFNDVGISGADWYEVIANYEP
ncbi:MAG: hypothetical protein NVS3B20_10780 [Polyangiales bacterium]